jgi:hypothetical protein
MNLSSFLPRTRSKIIFVLVMASYAKALSGLLSAIANAFGAERPPLGALLERGYPGLEVIDLLLFAPIIESLILIGLIELLRWLRSPAFVQIAVPAILSAAGHKPISHAIVVLPGFVIMAWAYLHWRRESWKTGFAVIALIHALLNLNGAIWTIGYALHYQDA